MRERLCVSGLLFMLGLAMTGLTGCGTGVEGFALQTPELSFGSMASHVLGDAPFAVDASSASSAPVSYAVLSGPAALQGATVTLKGAGTVVLGAQQEAQGEFAAAAAEASFAVAGKSPRLHLLQVGTRVFGWAAPNLVVQTASGGALTYSVLSGPATISGSALTITGVGTITVGVQQAASDPYDAAAVQMSFSVTPGDPGLTFAAIAPQVYQGPAPRLSVNSASNGAVTYTVLYGPATMNGSSVVISDVGKVVVRAQQAASGNYLAATAQTNFQVLPEASGLAFQAVAPQSYKTGAAPIGIMAQSPSKGTIWYSLVSGPATLNQRTLTITGAGTVVVEAKQGASGIYAAGDVTMSISVALGDPGLAFQTIGTQGAGEAAFPVLAQSASAGAVTYAVLSGPASVSGSSVTVTGSGTVVLSANQAQSGNYAAATATTSFLVGGTTAAAAGRLLEETSFGPTAASIAHVQAVGLDQYLTEQFAQSPTLMPAINVASLPGYCATTTVSAATLVNCVETPWWTAALTAPDQLRQRVAFALSEMFVVSTLGVNPQAIPQYQNALLRDAFGNFSALMKDVATSPAMGAYLNMLNNSAATTGKIANENFARENMQLFTIGTSLLNADGTLQLDGNGQPIPSYTEAQVEAFARAYTGWTYSTPSGATAKAVAATTFPNATANYGGTMLPVESAHDQGSKTLLNGVVLPGGQTAEEDLDGALGNLFQHPNIGPFICKGLIRHLVTSTPSTAYVARIAGVFADNGSGVRGDMTAVIRAILMDSEARAGDTRDGLDGGHLREPILYWTSLIRALGITGTNATGSQDRLSYVLDFFGQRPYRAPSVFNFYPAGFALPQNGLSAPEFGLENTSQVALRLSWADRVVGNRLPEYAIDLSATSALGKMAANPANLVQWLSTVMMHGQMPAAMQEVLIQELGQTTSLAQRARLAVYLVLSSPQYNVIH